MSEGIKTVFGGASFNPGRGFSEDLDEVFDILEKGNCHTIDSAALYGESERIIGESGASKRFTIDTKTRGGFPGGAASKEKIEEEAAQSKRLLGTNIDVFYIHAPDPNTDLEETLSTIDAVHKTGFFKRFGLSNYLAEDVQKVYDHCKAKGYVLPTVYQGNYSAVARKQEELLFPTLRKLGLSFYVYSPIAGGFLTKTKQEVEAGKGRFGGEVGGLYSAMYSKPAYLEALAQWEAIAKEEGCSRAALAYRWVKYNPLLSAEKGDAIIVGASSRQQLAETLKTLNDGPLSDAAVKKIDQVWETIKHEAPLDNYHR